MLADRALVVHLFTLEDAYPHLRSTWQAGATGLGMTRWIAALGLPDDLPADPAALPRLGAVAARQSEDGRRQAIVRRTHGALILSLVLLDDDWAAAESAWAAAVETGEDWVLGEARIFAAAGPSDALAALGAAWRLGSAVTVGGHTTAAEVAGRSDDRRLRRIVAVSDPLRSAESDAWLWSRGDDLLPPFAAYLLHLAKIRHQLRVRERYDQDVHVDQVSREADAAARDARRALVSPGPLSDLLDVRAVLAARTTGPAGLAEVRTRLSDMRRTVEIAVSNARAPVATGLFADDLGLAEWFAQRLDDDVHYLETAAERVRDTLAALSASIDGALEKRREQLRAEDAAHTLRRERLNLLQTAVIGSALMVLAAIQAFQYRPPVPRSVVPPVVAALGGATLLLATLALWVRSDHPALAWTGRVTAGLTGAGLAWLAAAVVAHLATGHPAAPAVTLPLAGASFAAGVLLLRPAGPLWRGLSRPAARRRTPHRD